MSASSGGRTAQVLPLPPEAGPGATPGRPLLAPESPWLADALVLCLLYLLTALAGIALTRQHGEVANLWFSNALAMAYLLTAPRARWLSLVLAAALANAVANRLSGDNWWVACSFLPANLLEIGLGVALMHWAGLHRVSLRSPRPMLALLACGGVLPQIPAAALGAAMVGRPGFGEFLTIWQSWFEGAVLGAVSVLALAVYARRRSARVFWREVLDWRVLSLGLLAVGVTLVSLAQVPFPFIYIALPLLLAATWLDMGALLVVSLLVSVAIAVSMSLGVFVWPPVASQWQEVFVYLAYGAALIPAQLLAAAMADMRDSHARLATTTEELRRANEGLEQFVRIASHDLREPLNTVVQFSELIEQDHRDRLAPEALAWLGLVRRAGTRMRSMLDDVLHYVRMQRGLPDPGRAVALDVVLSDVQQLLAAGIRDKGASVRVEPLPVVWGHESLLSLLFQNLLSNALKYMPAGRVPEIAVTARTDAGMAIVTVTDNGIGIAAKDIPKLFQPFSRLHLRKHYEGTGLGLALCRQIALAHGGRIELASVPDRGARFTVHLPLAESGGEAADSGAV